LMREPHDVYGVEPSESLRQLAVSNAPELAGRFYSGSLPGLSAILDRQFDGILCSAVFMHIPEEEHFDAACEIRNLLKPHGRLLLSVPRSRPDLDAESRTSLAGSLHRRFRNRSNCSSNVLVFSASENGKMTTAWEGRVIAGRPCSSSGHPIRSCVRWIRSKGY